MRSVHRRASWVLAAAGSVTLALTGLAQNKPASDARAVSEKAAVEIEVSPAVARLAEIKVELAWLGDRATFPCQLAARKVGGKLEVGGFVPDESLRKKAMDIARANCELPVVDKLMVHAGSAMVIARASHEELGRAAAAVLGRTLAAHAEPFSFETDASGEITITGLIPTWEDKLTVSRRLSQLPGCTGVLNQFRVRNQMRDGQMCNLVSIDGKLRVPAAANAVADSSAPKPPAFPEAIQRVEVAGTVPLLPTESPHSVATAPILLPPTPSVSGPVAVTPILTPSVVNAPIFVPSAPIKPPVAPPVVASNPIAPATMVLKKDATPVIASSPAVAPNSAPLKLPIPIVFGNNSTTQQSSTVVNVVASPSLPTKPVAATTTPTQARPSFAMQLGTPARTPTPAVTPAPKPVPSPIQQVGYQEPAPVIKQEPAPVSKFVSAPAPQPVSSPSVGSPYGGSPYGGTPYGGSAYSNNSSSVRSASPSPYAAGSPYGAVSPAPTPAPATSPGLIARVWSATPASKPTTVNQPVQVVQAAPTTTDLTRPATMMPAAPVAPKSNTQVPATLPSNVATAPVISPASPRPVTPSAVVPVAAQRPTTTPAAAPITSAEVQGFLCSRIEQIGQGKVRDLRIQGTASFACVISLTVPSAMEGQQVGQKIINMPELVPYKVDLKIRVQP